MSRVPSWLDSTDPSTSAAVRGLREKGLRRKIAAASADATVEKCRAKRKRCVEEIRACHRQAFFVAQYFRKGGGEGADWLSGRHWTNRDLLTNQPSLTQRLSHTPRGVGQKKKKKQNKKAASSLRVRPK